MAGEVNRFPNLSWHLDFAGRAGYRAASTLEVEMPFCPTCKYEYREGVKTCPECKVDLEAQPDNLTTVQGDFVEVYMVSNRMEAEVIQGLFEENEVELLVRDLRMFPVLPDFGRRARLRLAVPKDQEAQARKLLEEARSDGALTQQGSFL
jgi:hypothetical protein